MTGATCGAGNAYPSGAPDFTSGFYGGSCCFLSLNASLVLHFLSRLMVVEFLSLSL